MLTSAQQKVKQELDELQLKALMQNNQGPLSSAKRTGGKKGLYIFAGFCALFTIYLFLFSSNTAPDENLVSYLKMEQKYDRQSKSLLKDLLDNTSADPYQAALEQKELIKKIDSLKAPSSLQEHKQFQLAVMQSRLEIITILSATDNRNSIQVNKKIMQLKVKKGLATESLTQAFEHEKIKYEEQEDGTIHYWIQSKAYQY